MVSMAKITCDTTNCGVNGKNSPSTPHNVVSKVNFCKGCLLKFTFDTTFCGVEGEFLPSTPQFVEAKVNFCHRHHNLWCSSRNVSTAPNTLTEAEIVGVWKTKSYLEGFVFRLAWYLGKVRKFKNCTCTHLKVRDDIWKGWRKSPPPPWIGLRSKHLNNNSTRWSPIQVLTHQFLLNFKYRLANYFPTELPVLG